MKYHHQNLTDGELPLWRHGRAWLGKWGWEWSCFYRPQFHFKIGFETGGYSDDVMMMLCLGLFSLYIHRESHRSFKDRELSIAWHDGCIWLKLWCDDDWARDRPFHRNVIVFHVIEWFTGRSKCECVKGESFEVVIPMPEGCYKAIATPETRTWTWRFGWKKVRKSINLHIEGGIPFSGKGENSWDCGDDGLWGTGGDTVEEAIGNAVASVLRNRRRHGHDSKQTGKTPLVVLNEHVA